MRHPWWIEKGLKALELALAPVPLGAVKRLTGSRVYDGFVFYNELDLLEIRLQTLAACVDRFILVEATRTFAGHPKPLFYAENRGRFKAFHDKIVHVVVDDLPSTPDRLLRERIQRDQIARGLAGADDRDVLMIQDADEIANPGKIKLMIFLLACGVRFLRLDQKFCYYYLNGVIHDKWFQPAVCRVGTLRRSFGGSPDAVRWSERGYLHIWRGGWHFSFLGGTERIVEKLAAYSHTEYDTFPFNRPDFIREKVSNGKDLFGRDYQKITYQNLDRTWPAYVLKHQKRFESLLHPVT